MRASGGGGGRAIWAVDPLHRVAGAERQDAGEHLVEDDAHRIEIAARIDRAVHPAGLFGRHVGERAGAELGLVGRGVFARQARGEAEAGEVDRRRPLAVHQDIGRSDVLVDEPALDGPCRRLRRARSPGARKRSVSIGRPSSWASGTPPGSSSTSKVRPRSRTSSSGRAAQAPSSSSFSAYSCARRSRVAAAGCPAAGSTASTACRLPSAPWRHARQKTRSPSSHKTWKLRSPSAPNRVDVLNCRTPPSV